MIDDPTLPRDLEPGVRVAGLEERDVVVDDGLLHPLVENDAIPRRAHDAAVQLGVLLPAPLVKNPHLAVQLVRPAPGRQQQGLGGRALRGEDVVVRPRRVRLGAVAAVDDVQDEVVAAPAVLEPAEVELLGQRAELAVDAAGRRHIEALHHGREDAAVARLLGDRAAARVPGLRVPEEAEPVHWRRHG